MESSNIISVFLDRILHLTPFLFILPILYQLTVYFYNIFVTPLRKFPGPVSAAASTIPISRQLLKGNGVPWLVNLHHQYGEVVRVSPNEISFSSAGAWKDIYGHKKAGEGVLIKNPKFYEHPGGSNALDIVTADGPNHSRIRRIFAHAFSDKALKMQEPLFLTYVNKLVGHMQSAVERDPKHKFNMVNMYNFTTFDVMGDLTFAEPLGMLDNTNYHPWVASMFANFRFGTYLHTIRYYPLLESVLLTWLPRLVPRLEEQRRKHGQFTHARVDRRLAKKDPRPDIWGLVLARDEESGLSLAEMYANANLFMIAGTETTATLLSGLTYYLLKNPTKLEKLKMEIREAFKTEDEITIERLQALKYLNACVEEGLRMYPPVPNGLPRIVPLGGSVIDGRYVPAGTVVYVTHLAAYRNPNNFKDPYSFIPERWLSEEYASDKKQALQPFSIGPRNCLGKNMAYHEIRIILSKVLYRFDLSLCPEAEDWGNQKIFVMWDKGKLICQLTPVQKAA